MRTFITFYGLLFSIHAFSQKTDTTFFIKEVNWTFSLPQDFKRLDSVKIAAINERGKKIVDSVNDINLDVLETKTVFAAQTIAKNYFEATISTYNSKKLSDYKKRIANANDIVFKTYASLPGAEVDSTTTFQTVGGLSFNEFEVRVSRNGKLIVTGISLSKFFKDFDFGITYIYQDQVTKGKIESMLANSKFSR